MYNWFQNNIIGEIQKHTNQNSSSEIENTLKDAVGTLKEEINKYTNRPEKCGVETTTAVHIVGRTFMGII